MPKSKSKLGVVTQTVRGFELIDFVDRYGEACSLQQSSLAIYEQPGASAVWLGCDHETIHEKTGERCGARMHLDREKVAALIPHLQAWLKTGSFRIEPKKGKRK